MEENERIAKENALKEMENYNKIQDDLLSEATGRGEEIGEHH